MCFDSLLGKSKGELWPAMVLAFSHLSDFWSFRFGVLFEVLLRRERGVTLCLRFVMKVLVKDCEFW